MTLKEYLDETVAKIEELEVARFFTSPSEEQEKFTKRYVQHLDLDARNWFPFLRLDGTITNMSRLHFGNGGPRNISIVKKAIYDEGYKPLISDNALAGMFRIPLQTISRGLWGDDKDILDCGCFTERGHRFQCLKCLGCGIAGGLKPDTGDNCVHKVSAVTGISADGEIITEFRNALEPRTGTTPKKETLAGASEQDEGERRGKLAAFWQSEYVAPGAHFPISITFRDVAAVELGLALTAFDTSWRNIGLGSHKNGRFKGWNDNLEAFTLYAWMDGWLQEPEEYKGDRLGDIINQAKKAVYMAKSKKLLSKYVLDASKLQAVSSEKTRAKKRGG